MRDPDNRRQTTEVATMRKLNPRGRGHPKDSRTRTSSVSKFYLGELPLSCLALYTVTTTSSSRIEPYSGFNCTLRISDYFVKKARKKLSLSFTEIRLEVV